eukprot:scaffold17549_cov35-Attheya_sp.AAC.2
MEWIRKRENFTDDEIVSFQDTVDEFIELWIGLNGTQGMINYLHDLAAGHFSYYLRKYRNLYRYSQQGWEAFMGLLKTVDHSKTNFGEHSNGGELLFRTGDAAHYFENIKYPGKFDSFYIPSISTDRTERPSDAKIQAVVDDWSMDDWRVTYTDYDDEDEFEEEGV